ncbi:serine-rich adhesin for platelets-like [Amphibalanus amphitrite]|uniref:serine-rich adhesin for platelets-like n=1 Tax=Amphibalanus amphitrite TaxID=1232801 RepID=UPI001C8FF4A8|nr:serine-rich adhesin for platelets-like [Amphibalanus amphitrite]
MDLLFKQLAARPGRRDPLFFVGDASWGDNIRLLRRHSLVVDNAVIVRARRLDVAAFGEQFLQTRGAAGGGGGPSAGWRAQYWRQCGARCSLETAGVEDALLTANSLMAALARLQRTECEDPPREDATCQPIPRISGGLAGALLAGPDSRTPAGLPVLSFDSDRWAVRRADVLNLRDMRRIPTVREMHYVKVGEVDASRAYLSRPVVANTADGREVAAASWIQGCPAADNATGATDVSGRATEESATEAESASGGFTSEATTAAKSVTEAGRTVEQPVTKVEQTVDGPDTEAEPPEDKPVTEVKLAPPSPESADEKPMTVTEQAVLKPVTADGVMTQQPVTTLGPTIEKPMVTGKMAHKPLPPPDYASEEPDRHSTVAPDVSETAGGVTDVTAISVLNVTNVTEQTTSGDTEPLTATEARNAGITEDPALLVTNAATVGVTETTSVTDVTNAGVSETREDEPETTTSRVITSESSPAAPKAEAESTATANIEAGKPAEGSNINSLDAAAKTGETSMTTSEPEMLDDTASSDTNIAHPSEENGNAPEVSPHSVTELISVAANATGHLSGPPMDSAVDGSESDRSPELHDATTQIIPNSASEAAITQTSMSPNGSPGSSVGESKALDEETRKRVRGIVNTSRTSSDSKVKTSDQDTTMRSRKPSQAATGQSKSMNGSSTIQPIKANTNTKMPSRHEADSARMNGTSTENTLVSMSTESGQTGSSQSTKVTKTLSSEVSKSPATTTAIRASSVLVSQTLNTKPPALVRRPAAKDTVSSTKDTSAISLVSKILSELTSTAKTTTSESSTRDEKEEMEKTAVHSAVSAVPAPTEPSSTRWTSTIASTYRKTSTIESILRKMTQSMPTPQTTSATEWTTETANMSTSTAASSTESGGRRGADWAWEPPPPLRRPPRWAACSSSCSGGWSRWCTRPTRPGTRPCWLS